MTADPVRDLADLVATLSEHVETCDDDEVVRVHYLLATELVGLLRDVEAAAGARVHRIVRDRAEDPKVRRMTVDGLGTVEASSSGSRSRKWWGGRQVARLVALRVVDRSRFDPETGAMRDEPVPPAVLAEWIADEITDCAGLANRSASWRATALTDRGLDVSDYSEMEGESRPAAKWVGLNAKESER